MMKCIDIFYTSLIYTYKLIYINVYIYSDTHKVEAKAAALAATTPTIVVVPFVDIW